jgi:predicted nuclease with TOPRIM domain
MQVTHITVSAGRTFNHPYEQFSNLRSHVELAAELAPGEEAEASAKVLQAKAEKLAEEHKQHLLNSIHELQEMTQLDSELVSMEETITRSQEKLEKLRARRSELRPNLLVEGPQEVPGA